MASVTVRFRDYTKEGSGMRLKVPAITGANIGDYSTANTGHIDLLVDALSALTIGTIERANLMAVERVVGTMLPVNKAAQRENKALVGYHDSITGERYTFTIPTINTDFLANNVDFFDLGTTEWTNLVNVLEAAFVSPDGNLMVVDYAKFVGRNT